MDDRTKEEAASELDISVYDTERNEKAKKHRRELVSTVYIVCRRDMYILVHCFEY